MNAGMSDGCREVTRLRSTTTSWSTTLAPAFSRSPCTVFQAVMRWFLYSSAVSKSCGPWQIANTGLPAVMNALTNFTASSWARSLSGLPPPGIRRPSKSSGLTSLNVLSTVAFTLPLSPSICAPASRPTIVTPCPPAHDRGEPAPGRLDRQEVPGPRHAFAGPDPGGQRWADARGRQVRPPARLQVLDLRHLVDPAGGATRHRRPVPHDPASHPHRRPDEQAGQDVRPAP